ncbi:MAG: hypothetical protein ACETVY_00215 [Candidatus Bathyarchaeia archaeon]
MLGERGGTGFIELLMGSFLASAFVWVWMSALSPLGVEESTLPIKITLILLQYLFFGVGGFTAAYIVSARTKGFDILVGLKIGLGAWIISSTLFIPQAGTITIPTLILTLISFLAGSHLGASYYRRKIR